MPVNGASSQEPSGELGLDQVFDAAAGGRCDARPAAIRPSVAQAVCDGVARRSLERRVVVALAGFAPGAGGLLGRFEPVHGPFDRRMVHRKFECAEPWSTCQVP